MRHEAL